MSEGVYCPDWGVTTPSKWCTREVSRPGPSPLPRPGFSRRCRGFGGCRGSPPVGRRSPLVWWCRHTLVPGTPSLTGRPVRVPGSPSTDPSSAPVSPVPGLLPRPDRAPPATQTLLPRSTDPSWSHPWHSSPEGIPHTSLAVEGLGVWVPGPPTSRVDGLPRWTLSGDVPLTAEVFGVPYRTRVRLGLLKSVSYSSSTS